MTATAAPPQAPAWARRLRLILVLGVLAGLAAALFAIYDSQQDEGDLDPDAPTPGGSRAIAQILATHGVHVEERSDIADTLKDGRAGNVTIMVPFPELLSTESLGKLRTLAGTTRVVLVEPDDFIVEDLGIGVTAGARARYAESREPGCSLPEAVSAGSAELGTIEYKPSAVTTNCYGNSLLVSRGGDGAEVVLAGAQDPFTNERLDDSGNAALAMGLLSAHPTVLWLIPTEPELGGGERAGLSFEDLLPGWVGWAELLALLAGVLAILWRARRLGGPVAEPLPVIVRSAESVEGRARLYRRARATTQAYEALRAGAFARILPVLGLGNEPDYRALVEAVAERTGWPTGQVHAALYGAPPTDDAALVAAADRLDSLVRAVRGPNRHAGEGPQQ